MRKPQHPRLVHKPESFMLLPSSSILNHVFIGSRISFLSKQTGNAK